MTAIDRVRSVSHDRLTERQARFLVTVMQHSGVCLPRQYAAFAGIVYGQKTWDFFDRLVKLGHAVAYACRHHRGRVYHLRYKPLYRAVGNTDSRFRRSMSAAQVVERLAMLDAVISTPNVTWLGSTEDRQAHFAGALPEVLNTAPIGVDRKGRAVFLFLVMRDRVHEFRAMLQRCGAFLSTLPAWTVRVVVGPQFNWLSKQYDDVFRDELARPVPDLVNRLRWYFRQRQTAAIGPAAVRDEEGYFEAKFAFGGPRYQVLYRRWLNEGEAAFHVVSSPALADAIAAGTGRLECAVLPFSYRHLSPLVDGTHRQSTGAEEGEDGVARPQPCDRWRERIAAIAEELAAESNSSTSQGLAP
jgi:hypothetical protein